MHEQRDLVDQSMIHYDTRKLFVDIAEIGPLKGRPAGNKSRLCASSPRAAPFEVPDGTPVVNALFKQRDCLVNLLRACVGMQPDNHMLLEHKRRPMSAA